MALPECQTGAGGGSPDVHAVGTEQCSVISVPGPEVGREPCGPPGERTTARTIRRSWQRDSDIVPCSWFPAGARMMHSILPAAQEESRASARAWAMYSRFEDMVSPIHRSVHHFEKWPIPWILVDPLIGTLRGNQVSPACIGCNMFLSSWDLDRDCRTTVTPQC